MSKKGVQNPNEAFLHIRNALLGLPATTHNRRALSKHLSRYQTQPGSDLCAILPLLTACKHVRQLAVLAHARSLHATQYHHA
eukprot:6345347-Amphidinium_carterae.1